MEVFRQHGACVQRSEGLIKIPNRIVADALKKVPKEIRLYGRDQSNEIVPESGRLYFGFGGTPLLEILDMDTGRSRPSTKKDVAETTKLGDALPNMAYTMSIGSAFDALNAGFLEDARNFA